MLHELASLPTRNPSPAPRIDPYFDGLWDNTSTAAWWDAGTVTSMDQRSLAGGGSPWTRRMAGVDAATVLRTGMRDRRKRVLAAANLWRTLTFQQLRALTGDLGQEDAYSTDVRALWSADLVDVGQVSSLSPLALPRLVRPSSSGDWKAVRPSLTFDDWVGVTGGQPWRWGSQHDRHNVLTAEVSLRVAEHTPIPLVLGEHLSSLRVQAPAGVQIGTHQSTLAADATWVRPDGLRIMVETTVTTTNVDAKIQRWADMLASDAGRQMVVLFLHAPHPSQPDARPRHDITQAIAKAANSSVTHLMADVPARMLYAHWREWFPKPGMASGEFLALEAQRPTLRNETSRWETVSLLDPFAFPDVRSPDATAVLDNAKVLFGLPHWMRSTADTPSRMWGRTHGFQPYPKVEGLRPPPSVRAKQAA